MVAYVLRMEECQSQLLLDITLKPSEANHLVIAVNNGHRQAVATLWYNVLSYDEFPSQLAVTGLYPQK